MTQLSDLSPQELRDRMTGIVERDSLKAFWLGGLCYCVQSRSDPNELRVQIIDERTGRCIYCAPTERERLEGWEECEGRQRHGMCSHGRAAEIRHAHRMEVGNVGIRLEDSLLVFRNFTRKKAA